jgi:O-6-methylguanine DNA methyltransferase
MTTKARTELVTLPVATADGEFRAYYSQKGLAGLGFPDKASSACCADRTLRREVPANVASARIRRWHRTTVVALEHALTGRPPRVLPPLDLSAGTAFQQSVWNAMRNIVAGQSRSYGEIAQLIGKPDAARAVGGACGANPIPVLIPCHRVLAANHRLGGFSGGLDWKRKVLVREGVRFQEGNAEHPTLNLEF